ncbi:hypothetical protein HN873_045700 [Arachis hypogaea]
MVAAGDEEKTCSDFSNGDDGSVRFPSSCLSLSLASDLIRDGNFKAGRRRCMAQWRLLLPWLPCAVAWAGWKVNGDDEARERRRGPSSDASLRERQRQRCGNSTVRRGGDGSSLQLDDGVTAAHTLPATHLLSRISLPCV